MVMTWALLGARVPSAAAQSCPDIEVAFARGTGELPGTGAVGQAFVDSVLASWREIGWGVRG
jgi:cutinase